MQYMFACQAKYFVGTVKEVDKKVVEVGLPPLP
jgi:hypothetical protein